MTRKGQYDRVRSKTRLREAWRIVHASGSTSRKEDTKKEIEQYQLHFEKNLERIYRKLLKRKYTFAPSEGKPIKRKGKTPRPIVVSSIDDRIVRRAILDVLQEEPSIQQYLYIPTSFGGIKEKSVRDAIEAAYHAMRNGASYYIKSDIRDFFANIRRELVLKIISDNINDEQFILLLTSAITTELANLDELSEEQRKLFPIYEWGVAQGCCLSPLIGNILLSEFDKHMNGRGIVCLRYIDDFIILGESESRVQKAFESAKGLLSEYGLVVYDFNEKDTKAEEGEVRKGFDYLGCRIVPGLISPSKEARKRILDNIDKILKDSKKGMNNPEKLYKGRKSVIRTLSRVSDTLKGWGDQYSFCNNPQVLERVDSQINTKIANYLKHYKKMLSNPKDNVSYMDRRRLIGVHLLKDCKQDSILPLK